ncbi:hypothetical protein OG735_37750 [Streptomyces sp. NBC_01210]|nr:hypothetical protein OG735_37750 [Streptomyces sp. NBC_01210]
MWPISSVTPDPYFPQHTGRSRIRRPFGSGFGHNAMDYGTGTTLSSSFAGETQNRFLVDGLKWLGGGA